MRLDLAMRSFLLERHRRHFEVHRELQEGASLAWLLGCSQSTLLSLTSCGMLAGCAPACDFSSLVAAAVCVRLNALKGATGAKLCLNMRYPRLTGAVYLQWRRS